MCLQSIFKFIIQKTLYSGLLSIITSGSGNLDWLEKVLGIVGSSMDT